MRQILFTFALAVMSATGWAGWESSLRPWLCLSSFEEYTPGEKLVNGTAVEGGRWTVPSNVSTDAIEVSKDFMAMNVLTPSTNGIVLNVSSMANPDVDKAVVASLKISGFKSWNEVKVDPEKDRAAILIYAPADGEPTFQGLSANGWQTLRLASGLVRPVAGGWYVVSIRFMNDSTGRTRVQYRIFNGADYEPLQTFKKYDKDLSEGAYWLDVIGSDVAVREMEVRGSGAVEYLKGSEMKDGLVVGVSPR